jgi:hypothetical protein
LVASDRLVSAVATSDRPRYALAAEIPVAPSWISRIIRRSVEVASDLDRQRVERLAQLVGVEPDECLTQAS